MSRVNLEAFRKTPAYEAMSLQGKKAVASLALEGISVSKNVLDKMICFDKANAGEGALGNQPPITKKEKKLYE